MENSVLNEEFLATLPASLRERLIQMFSESTPVQIEKIKQHLKENDPKLVIETAHSLKGSGLAIGALQFSDILGKIQQEAKRGLNSALMGNLLQEAEIVFALTVEHLRQYQK
ncbi:MAG: Hpt domain-containing protein [SAR324 cluster bacterium]|nr:Hpt domain-containing protein [SAR324 cluster bacterium]